MPIGKDSITKRVAKQTTEEKNIAPELVATTAAATAKKAPAKKTSTTAKKPSSTASKSAAAKKPASTAAKKPAAKKPAVNTGVLSSVAPETVEAVIGHKEDEKYEKVSIGDNMPTFLL